MTEEELEKTRKLNETICPSCNKPMWKYTYVGGSYFYCSFCHLRKDYCKEIKEND